MRPRQVQPLRLSPVWVVFARRGLAAAAAVGIAFAGYQIGETFIASPQAIAATTANADTSTDSDLDFGLLESDAGIDTDFDGSGLFALAFADSISDAARGVTTRGATP
jgi:hypothetical protein